MYNADLHAPARWRLRAVSIGAGALFITGGSMVIGWAPTAMAAEPKPAPVAPAAKPAPAPKDDTSAADKKAADDAAKAAKQQADADKKAADQAAKQQADADKQAADAAKKAADADKKAADQAAKQQADADKQTAEAEKKAQQQAAKDAKNNPQTPPSDPGTGNSGAGNSGAGNSDSNAGQGNDNSVPPGQVDNPGNAGQGNNGDNGNHGTGNNGQGNAGQNDNGQGNNSDNGNHGVGNNGDNGNHGTGNNGTGNNAGGVVTPPGQIDNPGHHGTGNSGDNGHHGQGNSGKAVGHGNGPVTNVAFGDNTPGTSVGPEAWAPYGSAGSLPSPLSVLFLGQASELASPDLFDGNAHVLGVKYEASSPAAQLSASEMLKQFDKKSKARTQRVPAGDENALGAALSSSTWKSSGNAVPFLLLLLLAEMLILGRRFGNKLRRTGSTPSVVAASTGPFQVRWA